MPADPPDDRQQEYNRVFEFYFQEQDDDLDLVGLIAYALYKRQKRDWLIGYRAKHGNMPPSEREIDALTGGYLTTDARQTYRERAADILNAYAETYAEAREPQIRQDALSNETLRQARDIEQSIRQNSGFWRQVGTGLVATALWTLVVTAIVIAGLAFGSDLVDGWQFLASPETGQPA